MSFLRYNNLLNMIIIDDNFHHFISFYLFSTNLSTSDKRTNSYLLAAEAFSYSLLKVVQRAVASSINL